MSENLPPIYFYIPQRYFPQTIPASADENWQGFGIGIYAWTLQTYLRLKAEGFPCELVGELPTEGIVLVHRNSLRVHNDNFKPTPKLLLICLKAELREYPYAQIHIVQNPRETEILKDSYYIPHWSQPGLIPRNPARGDRFENIAFFGHEVNLAPSLLHPSWQNQLESLGLHWQPIINRNRWDNYQDIDNRWNDYSEVDAIVAVRSFDQQQLYLSRNYISKPATKLYNAWLASVPAILGCESAYQAERQHLLDYLEVTSPTDILSALKRLLDEPALRQEIVKNGQIRAQKIHPSNITSRWCSFLNDIAVPAYYRWCAKPRWSQKISLGRSYLTFNVNRGQYKMRTALAAPLTSLVSPFKAY